MFFLLQFLVSAADVELDIKYGSVFISGDENDDYYTIKYNKLDIQISKTDQVQISGTSLNNFINISITDRINTLYLIFQSFTISNEDSAIFIQGECTVNILIGTDVSISSSKAHPILISENSNIYIESLNDQQKLQIINGPDCSLIAGNGNIYVKNIEFDLQKANSLLTSFQGQIISLDSCTINLSTYEQSIGCSQASTIIIKSCFLYLSSQISSCIGNSENPDLKITIESSTVFAVTSSNNSPCIGNKNSSENGYINITNSEINCSINSIDSTFSVIGSSSLIQINSSSLILEATKGSAIGGGQSEDLITTIEIMNSSIIANSQGNAATIGGGGEIEMKAKISITENSQINAKNIGQNGAAIGGGSKTTIEAINIKNSHVNCSSFSSGSAIGSGNPNTGSIVSEITIESSTIFAENKGEKGQFCGAGIGGNLDNFIKIVGSKVTAIGGYSSAAIGGSTDFSIGDIIIVQSNISASSISEGAAIGSSKSGTVNSITIIESEIDSISGFENEHEETKSAAIGGGYLSTTKLISIKKSTVKAVSGLSSSSAAGIGGGLNGNVGTIEIEDSNVVSYSSLKSSLCGHKNSGGAGIGTGSWTRENDAKSGEKETFIVIKNSFVSSFGSNIHSKSENSLPLICGAAIGHGGFDDSFIDISIENSTVYAYGGNATLEGSVASSAFLGGFGKNKEKMSIKKSKILAVPGYAIKSSSNALTSAFGKNFVNDENSGLLGQISIENSDVQQFGLNNASNDYLSVVFDKFELNGSSDIELHSSCRCPIVSNDAFFSGPVLTLSNLRRLNMTQFTIYGEKLIFEKKVILGSNDDSVSLSLPFANEKYLIRAIIGEIEYDITDDKNENKDNLFTIKNGNNFFNNTKVVGNDEKITSSEILITKTELPLSTSLSDSQSSSNDNQGSIKKAQNIPLILGLAIGIPFAVGAVVFCIATYIILCRRVKKDPMQIPAQTSSNTMDQPLNEQELETIV